MSCVLENGVKSQLRADAPNTLCTAAAEREGIDLAKLLVDHEARVSGSGALSAVVGQEVRFLIVQGAKIDDIGVR